MEDALAWDKQLYLGQWQWTRRGWRQQQENQLGKKDEKKGRVILLRARCSAELGKVASGSVTQDIWLADRKVRSREIGEDRSRLPRKGTAGEARREGKRASDKTKKRVHRSE